MYFYIDINGLYRVDGDVPPAGSYILRKYNSDTSISIEAAEDSYILIQPTLITDIKRENGTAYTGLSDLLGAIGNFFK